MNVQYTAFGEMSVSVAGTRAPLTRRRERDVLSVLLAAHGSPVTAERLLAEVWGDQAAGTTLGSLQVVVSRLRTLLEPHRTARTCSHLGSTAAGYAVVAAVEDVDTWRFGVQAETALAATDPGSRLTRSEDACALWRGPPYAGTDAPLVRTEVSRLDELALLVAEQRCRALLDLGRPDRAQQALAEVAPRHPFRERLWALLALAQYRCARQADALATLRSLRHQLAGELGVDPTSELQRLEHAVLVQDPDLLTGPLTDLGLTGPSGPSRAPVPLRVREGRPRRAASTTVGRESVLVSATGLLDRCRAERSARCLLVAGEPGIGKSRLVEDLGVVAAAAGWRVLVARCHEGDYAPALSPWVTVVRALVAGPVVDPLLAPLHDGGAEAADRGSGTVLRMFDAVVDLIRVSAAARPLLLVLEDVHWADATSLQLLRHLVESRLPCPVTLVCTRRTSEARTPTALLDTMASFARVGAERIRLDGLRTDAVRALLTMEVGAHDRALADGVASFTGGNPFFVLQYARLLAGLPDRRQVDPATLPVPDGVRDVLRQRIARLPPAAVRMLEAAAVMGDHIDPDLVADLVGAPVEECVDLLDLALTSGLVTDDGAGYRFVHALERDVVYGELSAARRMRLHDRAGRVLESLRGHDPDAVGPIAHHAHLAAPLGPEQARRAGDRLARAARSARDRHAHPEALRLWRLVEADVPAEDATTVTARNGAAAALFRMGRTAEARASIDRAVQLAHQLGRWDLVAASAGILNQAGVWSSREHGTCDEDFIALLTEVADQVDGPDRARLLATLQLEHYYGREPGTAERAGRAALELARACGDSALLLEVLTVRVVAAWGPGRGEERLALVRELLDHRPAGELRVLALFQLGSALYEAADPVAADEQMERCAREAADLRHSGVEIPLAWWRFARARDLDDPAGPSLGRAALRLHRDSGYPHADDLECLARIRLRAPGQPVDPWAVERVASSNAGLRAVVAHALLEAGDADQALATLGEPEPDGAGDYSVLAARCLRLLVLAETDHRRATGRALVRVVEHAGRTVTYGSVEHLGAVDHFIAHGYAALGDARAVAFAERAVDLNRGLQCAPWLRRSQALLARLSG
ncbi:MAG: BTAD domain-containing putative transcriptional regulator [Nocardioidaceae bacterium]